MDTVDETALAVWADFLRLHAHLTDLLGRELVEEGAIPLGWYDVLVQLEAAGGSLRMQELAAAVVLSKSGLTRLVDRLEDVGYVERISCPSDRRGTLAEITPTGRAVLTRVRPIHLRGVDEHFSAHLDPEAVAALGRIMRTLLEAHRVAPSLPGGCSGSGDSPG